MARDTFNVEDFEKKVLQMEVSSFSGLQSHELRTTTFFHLIIDLC